MPQYAGWKMDSTYGSSMTADLWVLYCAFAMKCSLGSCLYQVSGPMMKPSRARSTCFAQAATPIWEMEPLTRAPGLMSGLGKAAICSVGWSNVRLPDGGVAPLVLAPEMPYPLNPALMAGTTHESPGRSVFETS